MIENINILLILLVGLVAMASPGPATLAIAGASMASGRCVGLALALGVTTGSILWSIAAAFGLGAVMMANSWMFELLRYVGAFYLIFLAVKSALSAMKTKQTIVPKKTETTLKQAYIKGLALHLTNPKAVLFFGSLYAVGIPAEMNANGLLIVICALGLLSATIFIGYAFLFSSPLLIAAYIKLRRAFETVFAIIFGVVGFKLLATRIE